MTTEVAERNERVDFNTFVEAVIRGSRGKKTSAEVADELGMKHDSFTTRLSQARQKYPVLKEYKLKHAGGGGGQRLPSANEVNDFISGLLAEIDEETDNAEVETETNDEGVNDDDES